MNASGEKVNVNDMDSREGTPKEDIIDYLSHTSVESNADQNRNNDADNEVSTSPAYFVDNDDTLSTESDNSVCFIENVSSSNITSNNQSFESKSTSMIKVSKTVSKSTGGIKSINKQLDAIWQPKRQKRKVSTNNGSGSSSQTKRKMTKNNVFWKEHNYYNRVVVTMIMSTTIILVGVVTVVAVI